MSSHRNSVRREIRSNQRGLKRLQQEVGDVVLWYEFDAANSSGGDTYQEGSVPDPFDPSLVASGKGLTFKAPTPIPVVWIRFMSPTQIQTEAGEYTVNRTSLRITRETMQKLGLQNPLDPAKHYNDRYSYNGFLYRVEEYSMRGWIHNTYLNVDVVGRELKEEELESDTFPIGETAIASTPWSPGQQLSWPATQPTDWESV